MFRQLARQVGVRRLICQEVWWNQPESPASSSLEFHGFCRHQRNLLITSISGLSFQSSHAGCFPPHPPNPYHVFMLCRSTRGLAGSASHMEGTRADSRTTNKEGLIYICMMQPEYMVMEQAPINAINPLHICIYRYLYIRIHPSNQFDLLVFLSSAWSCGGEPTSHDAMHKLWSPWAWAARPAECYGIHRLRSADVHIQMHLDA